MRTGNTDAIRLRKWPKTLFLVVFSTFLQKGSLDFAENGSECSPNPAARNRALRSDVSFR